MRSNRRTTSPTLSDAERIRRTVNVGLGELAEDAKAYLEKLEHLKQLAPGSDAYREAELEVDIQVGVLMVHAQSAHALLGELTDAMPKDDA
jgi:hypothetical protein